MKLMSEDDMLKKITKHFGIETELTKLTEEMGEFLNEAYKKYYCGGSSERLEDELADIIVLLLQIIIYFDIDMNNVDKIHSQKIRRTIERIDKNWYDKHR